MFFIAVRAFPSLRLPGSERRLGVVVLGLSCSAAGGIFPDQGSNPCLLHWQVDSLPLSHQGSPQSIVRISEITFLASNWVSISERAWSLQPGDDPARLAQQSVAPRNHHPTVLFAERWRRAKTAWE